MNTDLTRFIIDHKIKFIIKIVFSVDLNSDKSVITYPSSF